MFLLKTLDQYRLTRMLFFEWNAINQILWYQFCQSQQRSVYFDWHMPIAQIESLRLGYRDANRKSSEIARILSASITINRAELCQPSDYDCILVTNNINPNHLSNLLISTLNVSRANSDGL